MSTIDNLNAFEKYVRRTQWVNILSLVLLGIFFISSVGVVYYVETNTAPVKEIDDSKIREELEELSKINESLINENDKLNIENENLRNKNPDVILDTVYIENDNSQSIIDRYAKVIEEKNIYISKLEERIKNSSDGDCEDLKDRYDRIITQKDVRIIELEKIIREFENQDCDEKLRGKDGIIEKLKIELKDCENKNCEEEINKIIREKDKECSSLRRNSNILQNAEFIEYYPKDRDKALRLRNSINKKIVLEENANVPGGMIRIYVKI